MPDPIRTPRPDRDDILANIITGDELCNAVWPNGNRGLIGDDLEKHLSKELNLDDEELSNLIDNLTLFIEKLAEYLREREINLNGERFPFLLGHTPLVNSLSPATLCLAKELDLIKRPRFYSNKGKVAPHDQVARTSYWDLGDGAKHYLDMQAVRGLASDSPDEYRRGDRNESVGHAIGVELTKARWNAKPGLEAVSYVRLPNHVFDNNYANKAYDVVVFDTSDNSVVATIEVEINTNDTEHVADDAAKMANAPGKSIWCMPNKGAVNQLLRTMTRDGVLRPDESDPGFPHALATTIANDRVQSLLIQEKYRQIGEELPITEVCTFNAIRKEVQKMTPDVLSRQARAMGGGD